MGFNVSGLFYSKPKSLGEGLKRVVKAAGNGESGKLESAYRIGDYGAKQGTTYGNRVYSNGVTIEYATNNGGLALNRDVLKVSNGDNKTFAGIFYQNRHWVLGRHKTKMIDGEIKGYDTTSIKFIDRMLEFCKKMI